MGERPRVLIEKLIPVEAIGAESLRERGASSALPPLYFLHVWWARRPLTVSRAAILASLLPADTDPKWFLETIGIFGDPAETRARMEEGHRVGRPIENAPGSSNPYGYPRAFTYNPPQTRLKELRDRLRVVWGTDQLRVLDPFSGGGSIPFEGLRFGLETFANELNPVASVILKATLDYPARFGDQLAADIAHWGQEWAARARADLISFFPEQAEEKVLDYLWARTIRCPECGLTVPLSPNWWVDKTVNPPLAVRLQVPRAGAGDQCSFELVKVDRHSSYDPDLGTVKRGDAQCPRCQSTIDGDYVKAEAQAGRMGQQLYGLAVKRPHGRSYRAPSESDLAAVQRAESLFSEDVGAWVGRYLPSGEIPPGEKTQEPRRYGMTEWWQMFSPRQALVLATYVKHLQTLKAEIRGTLPKERADAVITYLAFALDKAINYNSRMSVWHSSRSTMANTFDRHDFSFKWSHAEFEGARELLPWAVSQVVDAYKGLVKLSPQAGPLQLASPGLPEAPKQSSSGATHQVQTTLLSSDAETATVHISRGSAADLAHLGDESIELICTDPPYYDNVMYSELSDFFYVWEKLTLGDVYPEWFQDSLTNKTDEAVANKSRFKKVGKESPESQAKRDYETKMQACFAEARRVLKPDGVFTIMFTHKSVDAWDTLASALIRSGFEVTASWPVHTESDHSLHQARKNAAQSTVLLVCRKRKSDGRGAWFDDIVGELRHAARQKAIEFQDMGLKGVDLYISTFGPVLQILSRNWPVKDSSGQLLRPDQALNAARQEVTSYRFQQILAGRASRFDHATEFAVLAWDIYQAPQIRYDEALKLARSVGIDIDTELKGRMALVEKSGNFVKLLTPTQRRLKRPSQVDPDAASFESLINAVHTACLVYEEDGPTALKQFFRRTNLHANTEFVAAVEALLKSIPQKKATTAFFRPLYDVAVTALEGKISLPQLTIDDLSREAGGEGDDDGEDES